MIKAVVFDLDHTLYDRYSTLRLIAPKIKNYFKINPSLSDDQIAEIMINSDKFFVHKGWDALQNHIINDTVLFTEKPAYDEYRKFVMGEFMHTAVEFNFVKPILSSLNAKGFKLGLITNGNSTLQRKKLEILGFNHYFDFIYVGGEHKFAKPSIEPFLITAKELSVHPNEMAYVGDNPINDIEASRNAGCLPIHINTTGTWVLPEIEKPRFSLDTVENILAVIEKYNAETI